jgi:hypothetical protein
MSRLRRLVMVSATGVVGLTGAVGLSPLTVHAATAQPATVTSTVTPSWGGDWRHDDWRHDGWRHCDRDHDWDRDCHHRWWR